MIVSFNLSLYRFNSSGSPLGPSLNSSRSCYSTSNCANSSSLSPVWSWRFFTLFPRPYANEHLSLPRRGRNHLRLFLNKLLAVAIAVRAKRCVINEDKSLLESEWSPLPYLHHAEGRFTVGYNGACSVVNQVCHRTLLSILFIHHLCLTFSYEISIAYSSFFDWSAFGQIQL